jgi:hypothetical protein
MVKEQTESRGEERKSCRLIQGILTPQARLTAERGSGEKTCAQNWEKGRGLKAEDRSSFQSNANLEQIQGMVAEKQEVALVTASGSCLVSGGMS